MIGGTTLDVAHLVGQPKARAVHDPPARATLDGFSDPIRLSRGSPWNWFTQSFGDLRGFFVYHRFDRIVIYGYLSGLSRP